MQADFSRVTASCIIFPVVCKFLAYRVETADINDEQL